jgi:hypothetical protein
MAESNDQEKFAKDFVPTFSASKLGDFCGNQSEATRIRFLRQHKPFSEIKITEGIAPENTKPSSEKNKKKSSKSLLDENEKNLLKQTLDESINTETLTFDDTEVIETFKMKLDLNKSSNKIDNIDLILNQLKLSEDKSSQEIQDEEYQTAESEGEDFVKRESKLAVRRTAENIDYEKELQVTRYISFMRGRKLEDHVLAKINKETEVNFVKNKSKTVTNFGMFNIVGIIDGISGDKQKILEIKTRNKLSHEKPTITSKERKQAMAYMKMHGCSTCLFAELGPDGALKKTEIKWNEDEFNEGIMIKLNEFCLYARNLSEQEFKKLLIKHQIS